MKPPSIERKKIRKKRGGGEKKNTWCFAINNTTEHLLWGGENKQDNVSNKGGDERSGLGEEKEQTVTGFV